MIKTLKHLRFMLVMLLATLGVNVAFGADVVRTYDFKTNASNFTTITATKTSGVLVVNQANYTLASSEDESTSMTFTVGISTVTAGGNARTVAYNSSYGLDFQRCGFVSFHVDNACTLKIMVKSKAGLIGEDPYFGSTYDGTTYGSYGSNATSALTKDAETTFVCPKAGNYKITCPEATGGSWRLQYIKVITSAGPVDPTITFSDANYEIGETLNLAGKFNSNSDGAVTYTVKDAGTTGATISGSNFTATAAGTAVVTASQAATASYNAATVDATITVTAASVKSAIVYANTKTASTAALPTQYTEGVGIAEFAALEDVTGFHFTGWNPSSISASATGEQTITAEWEEIILPCATMGPITSSVAIGAAPVSGLTLSNASINGKTVDANSNGLKLGSNDSRLKVTLNDATIVEGTKIVIKYKNPSANSGIGVFNGDYAHQVINLTGVSATGSVEHTFTAAEAANYSDAFIITRNGTGASNYINAIEVYGCGAAAVKHHVTYAKGDASVTGTLPTQDDVKEGATFEVKAKGDLAWDGHNFTGWNDGSADYAAGATYTMGTADVTLTAQWEEVDCSTFAVTCTNGQLEPFEEWLTYTRDQNATADIWAFNLVAVTGGTVATYEWYRNTEDSHEGAGLVRWNPDGDTEFHSQYSKLPDVSTPGIYYYFCKVTSTDGCEAYSKTITYTVNAAASSEKKLTRAVFSNGFDAFIDESAHTVTAYYLDGETAPTLSVENLQISAAATAAIDGSTITVTAEDGTTQDYAITLEAVTPATGGVYEFDAVPAWVKAPYGYDASKGIKFAKNSDDGRIQLGNTRQYYFVASCEKLILHTASGITSDRNITVYVNNVKVNEITKAPKYNAAGSYIEIPCNNGNAMVAIVSNQTGGDGGFGKAEVVEYIKSTDATLSDLTVNSATVEGFDAATETYNVELPFGTVDVPTVAATKNDEKASDPVITPAASLPGATTVVVTAEDGTTTKTYTINFTVLTTHYIAQVGATKCETVDEFVAAVAAIADATPTTITLLDNVDLAAKWLVIKPTQEVTLNLNGFMLENTYSQVIAANGKLTITGNGTIRENKASSTYAIRLGNDASLVTLENGTLTNATCTGAVVYGTKGQFVMNGGTIIAPGTAISHKNVDIKGGTITAADNALEVAGVISGGTITSANKLGVYANKSGELNITGGTITGATAAVKLYTTNTKVAGATLNGGFGFAGNASALLLPGSDAAIVATTDIEVYEGTTLLGYTTSALTDKIGKAGQTLKLTKDVTTDHYLAINADLDLNGHNITSSDVAAIYVAGTSATTGFRNITIKGEGNVTANNGAGCVAVMAGKFVHLTIEGGNYSAGGDADNAVIYIADNGSAGPSVVEIKGGHFESGDNQWILNIKDGLAAGGAKFITTGGTYAGGFYPDNCNVDGPHTNLCPENYGGILNADGSVTVVRLYTFSKWDGESINFEKKNAADELEFTVYSTNTGGRQNSSTALLKNQQIDRTDATLKANVLSAQQFVIKFEKEVKQVKLYAYNGNTGRALSSVKVTDADNIDATPSWSDAGFTLTSNTLATNYDYEYIIDGHFEAGKYYFIKTSNSVSFFDIFYTEAALESEAAGIVAGTIDGVDMTAEQIAELNGAEHTLTLAGAVSIAPEVVFNYKHTATYDDAFVKTLVEATEAAEEATVGATYEMSKAFEDVTYKVVANIDYTPALALDVTEGTAAIAGKTGRSKEFTVVLEGANLAAGEYSVNVPAVDGLSVAPATFTVGADNKVNETFVITYASDADVAEAVANIEFTANTLVADPASKTATFALTYSSVAWVEPADIEPISASTTWRWADIADQAEDVTTQFTDIILSTRINATAEFKSQSLKATGTRTVRLESGHYFAQVSNITFETTVPGFVTISMRSTGSGKTVTATIQGTEAGSATNTFTTLNPVLVQPGEVSIDITGNGLGRIELIEFLAADYARTLNGNIGTICLEKAVAANHFAGATFYEIAYTASNSIFFDEVTELEAGMPYIFVPEAGATQLICASHGAEVEAGNKNGLYGSYSKQLLSDVDATAYAAGDLYVILDNQYRQAGAKTSVGKNRAYINLSEVPTSAVAPAPGRKRIVLGGQGTQVTTGIDAIEMTEDIQKLMIDGQLYIIRGGKMYNANGQLVK